MHVNTFSSFKFYRICLQQVASKTRLKKQNKKKKGNWTKRDLSCTKLVTFKIKQVDNSLTKG